MREVSPSTKASLPTSFQFAVTNEAALYREIVEGVDGWAAIFRVKQRLEYVAPRRSAEVRM